MHLEIDLCQVVRVIMAESHMSSYVGMSKLLY